MANFSALKTAIQNAIKQNGNEEITGDVLQQILLSIVSTMGDGAINTIEQNLSQETLARQNGDNTLQQNINAEALARGNADTQLQNAINAIKANIDNGYVYAGIATPTATPVSGKVFYIATAAGTYTNFGGQVLTQGINILRFNGSAWSSQQLIGIDDVPTAGSNKLVKSGGVQNEFALGAVYDVTAKNPTAGHNNDGKWESLYALLSDANLNTLIPTSYRKGGMSIKFVQSSDNNYVQFRFMLSGSFTSAQFTNPANWQVYANEKALVKKDSANTVISDETGALFVTDAAGNVICRIDNNGVNSSHFIVHLDGNQYDLYSLLKLLQDKKTVLYSEQTLSDAEKEQARENIQAIGNEVISDEVEGTLYISDENRNVIAKFDREGLHVNKSNSNLSRFIVCDNSGNIAFRVNKNGESDLILSLDSFVALLNKTYNYKYETFDVDIPSELFRVTNDIYPQREYAPRLFAERLQETDNELSFENGSKEWYVARKTLNTFSGSYKTDSVSRQIFMDMYRRKNISFNLRTTKASVFYEKTLNFLPLGDSITDHDNWDTYLRKLLLMDNVDWQIANSSDVDKYGMQTIGTKRSTNNVAFTYRNKNVNVDYNYNEGRSSWAAATYLRHAEVYTWDSVTYNGSTKSILHVAWRILGLHEKYNVEYNGTVQQKNYIRTTCNGQYAITSACIDGYVWNRYRNKIGYDSVDYSNATSSQKDEMITYLTSTLLDNPSNPFFSKTKVLETKDSDNCYAFDWDTYYARYKTHNESGEELETKGTKATSSMHVCVPNIVGICLGTNDSVWESEDTLVNMQDAYQIAELFNEGTGATVIIFANGVPQSCHVANYKIAGSQYDYSKVRYYQLKNQKLKGLCGDFTNQTTKNIFYCPCYYVQSFGNYNDNPLIELYTENHIGSVLTMDDIHPNNEATAQWSYEIYSLMAYLVAKNIIQ